MNPSVQRRGEKSRFTDLCSFRKTNHKKVKILVLLWTCARLWAWFGVTVEFGGIRRSVSRWTSRRNLSCALTDLLFQISIGWPYGSKTSKSLRYCSLSPCISHHADHAFHGARIDVFRVCGSPFDHLVRNSRIVSGLNGKGNTFQSCSDSVYACILVFPSAHRGRETVEEIWPWPNTGAQIWKIFLGRNMLTPWLFGEKTTGWVFIEPPYRREITFVCWLICQFSMRTFFLLYVTLCPPRLAECSLHMGTAQKCWLPIQMTFGNERALRIKLTYLCLLCFHFLAAQAPLDAPGELYESCVAESVFSASCRPTRKIYPFLSALLLWALFYVVFNKVFLPKALTHHLLRFSPSLQIPRKHCPSLSVRLKNCLLHQVLLDVPS